ncbi:MAG TPA: peptide-methionine (S)-S-oxide reductase [Clostridiales bacterium UBA8960]|nr:peptide-methionine (S)-S-oxide reductase [Clostridiales bacterium UBA8960]
MKKIVLGGGCFWGMEAYFKRFEGVLRTEVGYANGHTLEPTYKEVCSNTSGHVEVLLIEYDPEVITLEFLLGHLWKVIDPTLLNRQGGDIGSQYRTGIYYLDEMDLPVIEASILSEQTKYEKTIVTEVEPLNYYYPAEEYHQDYLTKNPGGYCHIKLD